MREWRKQYNEAYSDLYSSPSIIRISKSSRIGWTVHVAQMEKERNAYRLLVEKQQVGTCPNLLGYMSLADSTPQRHAVAIPRIKLSLYAQHVQDI
jgi:hypothetical protein